MSTAERVATLYLMYAMYFKQPANNFCRFRFTQSDWQKMKQFYDSICVDAKYLQARTIFWRLWQHNAFRFVDCDREQYPETMQFHRLQNDGLDNFEKINTTIIGRLDELQNEDTGLMSAIGTIQMGYNEMKEHFANTQRDCTELQNVDVIGDIGSHMKKIRKLFESKFDGLSRRNRIGKSKAVKRMLLAGSSKAATGEQESDLDSDLNESNDESTTYSGDLEADDGDDDDSNNDNDDVDNDTENECLNIGTKRYYLKRKAEQNTVGDLHTRRSSVFPSKTLTPTKIPQKPTATIASAQASTSVPAPAIETIVETSWPDDQSFETSTSIEQTPLSIDDIDGRIVISHPKKVYNRYSKEYRSSVRKQFIDCPE